MMNVIGQDNTFKMLEGVMNVASLRHSLVASNIANVDTPGYRAVDIDFERELKVALRQSQKADGAPGSSGTFEYTMQLRPRVYETNDVTPRQDGNTVDLDKQLGKLSKAARIYTQATTLMAAKIKMITAALQE